MAKKIVSIFLTLSMVVSLFASLNINVFAAEVGAIETYSGNTSVDHYRSIGTTGAAAKTTASEVVAGLVNDGKEIVNAKDKLSDNDYAFYKVTKDGNGVVETPVTDKLSILKDITDPSTIVGVGDLSGIDYKIGSIKYGRDDQGYYSVGSDKNIIYDSSKTSDEDFVIKAAVQYRMALGTNISDIVVASGAPKFRTGYYTILTSDDAKNWTNQYAYACDRQVGDVAKVNSGIQHIKFDKPVVARYVRIEVYANINTVDGVNNILNTYTRLYAFAVFGSSPYNYTGYTETDKNADLYKTIVSGVREGDTNLISGKNDTTDSNSDGDKDAKLEYFISSKDLENSYLGSLPEGYVADEITTAGKMKLEGWTDGDITYQDNKLVGDNTLTKMFATADGTPINDETKQFLQVSYELDSKSEISQVVLAGKETNIKWNFTHYKYYFADTWDDLFKDENCYVEIDQAATISTVKFNTPVEAKYVGVRIIGAFGAGVATSQAYIRTAELEVYGTAIQDDTTKTYTVTYKDGETVVETFTVEEGKTLDAIPAVPTKDGYNSAWDLDLTGKAIDGDKTVNAVHTIKTYTVTFMADGKLVEEVQVDYGKAATAPAAPAKEGYTFTGWDVAFTNVKENITVTAQYAINKYTVTFMADGEIIGEAQTVEHGAAATAPAAPAKYGYTFKEWDKEFANVVADIEVNAVYDFTGIIVKFESITGKLLGEVIVEEGAVPSNVPEVLAQIKEINKKVEAVYGYTVKRNDNGDVFWSNEVYDEAITTEVSVRPEYEAIENLNTNVKVYDVNGTELINENARYDSAITLASKQGATYWADKEGKVLLAAESGTLYACGTVMNIYAKKGAFTTPAVAIVGKINDGNFLVFAHVNVENATEYGVIFASNTAYGKKADFNLDDAAADKELVDAGKKDASYTVVKIDTTNVSDFMASLNKTGDKTRYARAYVKVGDNYIYTDAICNNK